MSLLYYSSLDALDLQNPSDIILPPEGRFLQAVVLFQSLNPSLTQNARSNLTRFSIVERLFTLQNEDQDGKQTTLSTSAIL